MSQIREDFLWVEKWRPTKVADCVLPSDLQEPFLEYVESGKIPNLIFAGKPGINSKGIGLAVNGMYSTADDWTRLAKPFHLRCYDILRSNSMDRALKVLTSSPRSCTANYIIGHSPRRAVDVELAPDKLRLIYSDGGIISHANHFVNPDVLGVSEPPNPRRFLSEFRQQRMELLLKKQPQLDISNIQKILKDHENNPQSLCRHRDASLSESQHTITKTAMIMDLDERKLWATDGQPCKSIFEEFSIMINNYLFK